ncbi:outer membrane beta-barrel protein [Sulfurimonas sp.]|uniref:outer membrane beta-barrel protein n=1 Tax=Sulfurimonas sp. TaxID=2022749 RepID=UPI0025F83CF8|nr:outer membrane beta-barrel protein [Sulfurimonas sp.]
MKKIVLAALLASGLMAADSGVYVGVDLGNTAYDAKASAMGISATEKDDGGSQTLKVGYYFDKNNRASAFFQNVNTSGGKTNIYGVGYDYLIGDNALKPFIGAILGHGSSKADDNSVDLTGAVYGAQAGVNYSINENFSVEAGFRYMNSKMQDTIVVSGVDVKIEADPITNWFIGANYKF